MNVTAPVKLKQADTQGNQWEMLVKYNS